MSFPGPVGGAANLACDTALQRATDQFNFQLNTGAAGGNESTLQSPASVTPDVNRNVSLAMTATLPGSSTLTMQGGSTIINMTDQGGTNQINMNGQNASVNLSTNQNATVSIIGGGAAQPGTSTILLGSTNAGGVNDILFGNPTTTGIALYQQTTLPGELGVGNNFTGVNIASFNQTTNAVVLGQQAVAGTINLNGVTTINRVGGANGIVLTPLSADTSTISQTVAASGTLGIGSSLAFPQTLRVSDVPYLGASCYVEVFGPAGSIPLFLSAAQGVAGECGIHPDAIPGTGQLLLGSDNTNVSAIRIASQATTINNLGGAPQLLYGPVTVNSGTNTTFPGPVGEGLYSIVGSSVPTSTQNSRDAQFSCIAYINSSGRCQMGGSANADVGGVGGVDSLLVTPVDGATTFNFTYTGGQQVLNFSIYAFKLSGPILGTV